MAQSALLNQCQAWSVNLSTLFLSMLDSRRIKPSHAVQMLIPVSICDRTIAVHPRLIAFPVAST